MAQEDHAMTHEHILVEREDGVGIVTPNRPEVLNAMNRRLSGELVAAVPRAAGKIDKAALKRGNLRPK